MYLANICITNTFEDLCLKEKSYWAKKKKNYHFAQ